VEKLLFACAIPFQALLERIAPILDDARVGGSTISESLFFTAVILAFMTYDIQI
jgi:hypothetical protein